VGLRYLTSLIRNTGAIALGARVHAQIRRRTPELMLLGGAESYERLAERIEVRLRLLTKKKRLTVPRRATLSLAAIPLPAGQTKMDKSERPPGLGMVRSNFIC
jgi:hypothetical protein